MGLRKKWRMEDCTWGSTLRQSWSIAPNSKVEDTWTALGNDIHGAPKKRGEWRIALEGPAKRTLGMVIIRDQKVGRSCLSQKSYNDKVLEKFAMHNPKAVSTPFVAHLKLFAKMWPQIKEEEFTSQVSYSNVVESLMHDMVCTRLDILHILWVLLIVIWLIKWKHIGEIWNGFFDTWRVQLKHDWSLAEE